MSAEAESDQYLSVPYPSGPIRVSHPELLHVVAALSGLNPAPADRCRVLEIGCASGGNLLPMAAALPGSEFLGIEPSGPAVDGARSVAQSLGLRNLTVERKGVEELDDSAGLFDYILTHGVFSWVSAPLQERILEVSRRLLKPDGIAYISYNTYPGWHSRGMIRDMVLYHVRNERSPEASVTRARQFLARLTDAASAVEQREASGTDPAAYGAALRHERALLEKFSDAYIAHEHLERDNRPLYFHQFAEMAARHGLRYVSEAFYSHGRPEAYAPAIAAFAGSMAGDPVELQQYLDFASNGTFRETVLCSASHAAAREPDPERLRNFYASSSARSASMSGAEETFAVAWGRTMTTSDPLLRAALRALGERWPAPLSYAELESAIGASPVLPGLLLQAYSRGMLEFQSAAPRFTTKTDGRLLVGPLARLQARNGASMTNQRHELISLDALSRSWVAFLDGSRDEAGVLELLVGLVEGGRMAVNSPEGLPVTDPAERRRLLSEALKVNLRLIANSALLEPTR